jgi:hypothetical protein
MSKSINPSAGIPARVRQNLGLGPGKRGRAMAIFRSHLNEAPSELDRKRAAEALGLARVDDVPDDLATVLDLLWWLRRMQAVAGSENAIADFLDRATPKPRRMEVTGADGAPLRAHISAAPPTDAERAAADDYYRELTASPDEGDGE